MQFVNDDMDELFRRAGEEYPLKTGGADWDKVMQGMHHKEEALPERKTKRVNYKYLLLLLLLPVGFICGRYTSNDKAIDKTNTNATERMRSQPIQPEGKRAGVEQAKATTEAQVNKKDSSKKEAGSKADSSGTATTGNSTRTKTIIGSNHDRIINGAVAKASNKAGKAKVLRYNVDNPAPVTISSEVIEIKKEGVKENSVETPVSGKAKASVKDIPSESDTSSIKGLNKEGINESEKDSGLKDNRWINKKTGSFDRRFYYSLIAGPDISTVKFQAFRNAGYSIGLGLGYQFNGKTAFEAGALISRKKYYTNGSYLDTSRLKLPAHSIVSAADGYCTMLEIPININYTFITKATHSWFVSGGLSTYLMLKENYNLTYSRYNQQYIKDYGYDSGSNDWFSILNVSVGYQKFLGKTARVTIAPYLKVPLREVGIGKLPITSTGVHVSFSGLIQ